MREEVGRVEQLNEHVVVHLTGEEIVRCRDCRHLVVDDFGNGLCTRASMNMYVESNGFCAWGERESNGN